MTPNCPAVLTPQLNLNGWHGQLHLVYNYADKATRVAYGHTQAPLKLQRPFYPDGPEICHTVVIHTAGGVVGGDSLSCTIELQPQTQVLLTSAAAQRVYRSAGLGARQTTQIQIENDACLEWLPQETIVFAAAQYSQTLVVELAAGASWLGWDITRFGRTARGEAFLGGNWRSQTQIWRDHRPLWIDQQWLPGRRGVINSPHGLHQEPVVASLAWVGQPVESAVIDHARALWAGSRGSIGVTRLQQGLLCRYRGASSHAARQWFIQVWQLIRTIQGRPPAVPPRVWQL